MIRIGSTIFGAETINIMIKKVITTEKLLGGPYSQAFLVGNTLYCSGQIILYLKQVV